MNNIANISADFYNARDAYKAAQKAYKAKKESVKRELVSILPTCGDGVTAAELSKECSIKSRDIASILENYRNGYKFVAKTYVLVEDDGTVDYSHKITKRYRVNTYRG